LKLTREEAIRKHRELWNWIAYARIIANLPERSDA